MKASGVPKRLNLGGGEGEGGAGIVALEGLELPLDHAPDRGCVGAAARALGRD